MPPILIAMLRVVVAAMLAVAGLFALYIGFTLTVPGAVIVGFDASNWADLHDGNPMATIDRAPVLTGNGLLVVAVLLAIAGLAALAGAWIGGTSAGALVARRGR